nr:glycosyltransferase family A protein [Frigoribacterium sp. CG_9.8]
MAVAVVIPANNEQDLVGACLESVKETIDAAQRAHPALPVRVVLVADSCEDNTVAIARSAGATEVLEVALRNVGAARRAGVAHALAALDYSADQIWIANTDADSVVPSNWILEQLELAHSGFDLMIGTVHPTFTDLSREQLAAWRHNHRHGVPNGHAHGANLGIRASAYIRASGFPAIPEHEDNNLVDQVKASGARVVASDRCDVETSGRQIGRTNGGYARFLHGGELESQANNDRTVARHQARTGP